MVSRNVLLALLAAFFVVHVTGSKFAQIAAKQVLAIDSFRFLAENGSDGGSGGGGAAVDPCPFPLHITADPTINNAIPNDAFPFTCAFACFGTMISESELETYNTLEIAISGVGMFFALFLVATWGLFAAKSKQKMTFWISVCSLFITGSIFIAALAKGSTEEVWCKNENEGFKQKDGVTWCFTQGLFIIFFGLALCCWWFCSCFDIFAKLYLRWRNIQHFLKYYHIFSWSIPGIVTLVLLSTSSFGFEQPRLWCFLDADAPDSFEFIFFYGEVAALWLGGTIMMFLVIWSILVQTRSYRRGEASGSYFKKLALYKTPILFVAIFSVFWAIFFSFRLITRIDEDQYTDSAISWFTCLLVGKFGLGPGNVPFPHNTSNAAEMFLDPPNKPGQVGCGETQPGRIPPGLLYTATITISANSILIFLIFGLQAENYQLWWKYFKSVCIEKKAKQAYGQQQQHGSQTGSQTDGKGSVVEAVVSRANDTVSTFVELYRGIVFGVVWTFALLTCQERPKFRYGSSTGYGSTGGMQRPNRSPRLKFDQPNYSSGNVNANYQPRFYQGSNQNLVPGMANYSAQLANKDNNNAEVLNDDEEFPPYVGRPVGQQHQSVGGWSDAYDDPLWGINVEF